MTSIRVSRELQAVLAREGQRAPRRDGVLGTSDEGSDAIGQGADQEAGFELATIRLTVGCSAAELPKHEPKPSSARFSFNKQGEPLPGIYEATPMEIAAQFAAISRAQIRRRSYEMAAPDCQIDRNLAVRIIVMARSMERESYKRRARYQHRGVLGDLGLALLELLLNFGTQSNTSRHTVIVPGIYRGEYSSPRRDHAPARGLSRRARAGRQHPA